jgi:peptidoglycan-associated lipoprotein
MNKITQWMTITSAAACLLLTGCNKKETGVWDDSKSATSFNGMDGRRLWGNSEEELSQDDMMDPKDEDFISLKDEDLKSKFADGAIPQPKNSPGEAGSGLPGIEHFSDPSAALTAVFRTLYFNTDDHVLRGKESLATVDKVADYLKSNPNTYIFITGHCDERGPEAYNLSLGARRANYVRTLLVQKGVNLNQIHTVSYGKERPAVQGHNQEAWAKNRRAEFKIYQK